MDRKGVRQSAFRRRRRRHSDASDRTGEGNSSIYLGKNIDSLPEEILFQIILLLPAEFLHDCARLVCRKWKKIIHSKAFINAHNDHQSTYGLLLESQSSWVHHRVYMTSTQGRIKMSDLIINRSTSNGMLASSANGLAVEFFEGKEASNSLCVINPATKQSFLLPSVSTQNRVLINHSGSAIAYSAASKEYKVTLPYIAGGDSPLPQRIGLDILTVGVDESWRKVAVDYLDEDVKSSFILLSRPLTSEGFLHWGTKKYIVTLDVETEVLSVTRVPIPLQPHYGFYSYISTGKSLSMLLECGDLWWEVWEMKPETREWREVLRHKVDLTGAPEFIPHKCNVNSDISCVVLSPFGWIKYLEVLAFMYQGEIPIVYNLDTREIETIELPWLSTGIVHKNNLVWLS